ncbi:MAG: alpha/beta hydrolase-fold protein [Candidatus Eiseniibacteriota bacterium]
MRFARATGFIPSPAIEALRSRSPLSGLDVEAFLAAHRFPLIEGSTATFVWRGEAVAVHLVHMIFGLPTQQPFIRLEGSDLWYLTLELPSRSRVEYKIEVVRGADSALIEDPLNPLRTRDPFGTNSVVQADGYTTPEWVAYDPEARPGTLEELVVPSEGLGRDARVTLYLPARFRRARRYPLLLVHDGGDFLAYGGMKTVLDNLFHRHDVAEMLVAFLHPGERLVEYADHPGHARFLAGELTPLLERDWPLVADPAERGIMGASFGAVAALAAAARFPGRFGRLLLLSGSFAFTDIGPSRWGPAFEPVVSFVNAFRQRPTRVSDRVFLSCGTYESLIYENRSMVPLLQSTGMEVRYVEARDGHNWENWRDRLREGLSWLFPGPLWMIYE